MKVLFVHTQYQIQGGEDFVFSQEVAILRKHGIDVFIFNKDNDILKHMPPIEIAANVVWNQKIYLEFKQVIRSVRPDVIHIHNTFPMLSPGIIWAAQNEGIPVVQTLHNYRLLCLKGTLERGGRICDECVGRKIPWPGIKYGCYRGKSASSIVALMLFVHRILQTYANGVQSFIATSHFARAKFIEGGLPAKKIFVKPNFLADDPGISCETDDFALFLGRLSEEKGIKTLLQAWKKLGRSYPLYIIGHGPLQEYVKSESTDQIYYLGRLTREEVINKVKKARFLILPSLCYENQPMTLVEAFACGVPVLGSRIGSLQEQIRDGETGLLFTTGDPDDLAAKAIWMIDHHQDLAKYKLAARKEFENLYSGECHLTMILGIYQRLLSP